jgi:hypothetical protein
VGEGRRRAEEIDGRLGSLRDARRLATFLARGRITSRISAAVGLAFFAVLLALLSADSVGDNYAYLVGALGGIVLVASSTWLPRLILNGKLTRPRPRHDWQAIGAMISAVIALPALIVSLVAMLKA